MINYPIILTGEPITEYNKHSPSRKKPTMAYNPPPNWPAPPPGWEPPPGWRPNPDWPLAPADHHFGVPELDNAALTETAVYPGPLYRDEVASGYGVTPTPAPVPAPAPVPTTPVTATVPAGAKPLPKKGRNLKWLAWAVPSLIAVVLGSLLLIYMHNMKQGMTASAGDPPASAGSASAPVTPPGGASTPPGPSAGPSTPILPRTTATPTKGKFSGGLSADLQYALYKGSGNADVPISKPEKGINLIEFDYKGSGSFKVAQLNSEGENTGTLANVEGDYHGKYILDLFVEDGTSTALRVKSSGGPWSIKIMRPAAVKNISDVKTYVGEGDDVLWYPYNVKTNFKIKHPSEGPFVINRLAGGKYTELLNDKAAEGASYTASLSARGYIIVESWGSWSMNPE